MQEMILLGMMSIRKINSLDLNSIGQHFKQSKSQPYPIYDVNGDGVVDDLDLDIVNWHFGETY